MANASSVVIDILEPASSFVLANVLTDEPYQMGAETVRDSRLLRIPAASVRAMIGTRPSAAMAMIRSMSAELASMMHQVVDLKGRIAAQRLGTYLLSQVREPTAVKAEFRLPVSKGLLASWLGCRAENLSRAFLALRAYGVETHGSRVLLHDMTRLLDYAGVVDQRPSAVTGRPRYSATPSDCVETGRREQPIMLAWSASLFEVIIYCLCVVTSVLCSYLLAHAYRISRAGLLLWSALSFALLAASNLILAVDILLLPTIDLTTLQLATAIIAVGVLLYGFIWEVR
jgi:CRP/FNR family transcriptional activator FtrB